MVRAAREEPRQRGRGRRPRAATSGCSSRSRPAGSRSTTAAGSPPRRSGTPPPTTSPSRPGWAACSRPERRRPVPGLGRRHLGAGARRLRYGENPHQAAALYTAGRAGGLAGAEQLHGKEMSYNNYVDADAAWRAAHDHGDLPTVAVIKHANPCGIAVGADVAEAHRKAHATRPGERVRRRDRGEPRGHAWRWPSRSPRSSPRSCWRRRTRRRRAGGPARARRTCGCCACPERARAAGAELRPISGGLLLQQRDLIDAAGDDPASWTLATGDPVPDDDAGRPRLRLAGLPRGEVQRDPAGAGRGGRRHRDGPGEPGRRGAARGRAGRRPGPRVGGRLGRVLPVPGRAGGAARGRGPGGRAARRLGARRPGRRGRGRRGRAMYLTGTRHFAH